jgi:hypothetical protein
MLFAGHTLNGGAVIVQGFRLLLQAVGIRFGIADALFHLDFLMLQMKALDDAAAAKKQVPHKRSGNGDKE